MKLAASPEFFSEKSRYALKHCCEECVLFDARRQECAHEWPNEAHRRAYYEGSPTEIVFCKEFELG